MQNVRLFPEASISCSVQSAPVLISLTRFVETNKTVNMFVYLDENRFFQKFIH